MFKSMKDQKGFALISVYMVSIVITTVTAAAYSKALFEMRAVDREMARIRSLAVAEAGIQNALAQIGANAYTGFINTNPMAVSGFQSADGKPAGSYSVTIDYPNQADWVIVSSTATVDGDTKTLEGRVFLDSNLSKYLVYADTPAFASGTNAQYGEPDYTDEYGDGDPDYPELVPANEDDRAALYFTGSWDLTGSNVHLYGDAHAHGTIDGNSSSTVHGDTYASPFSMAGTTVTNSGVTGGLHVGDGFSDDTDRNNSGSVTATDYPDYHDLTSSGDGDAHKTETLVQIDHNFYAAHNSTPGYAGSSATNRYLKFVSVNGGTQTQIQEYTNANFTTLTSTQTLAANAIVYVKGDIYLKGEVGGRVSIVSSDDIFIQGNMTYSDGQVTADPTHSMALLAKDLIYFRPNDLTASGILYGENSSNSSVVFDSNYDTAGNTNPGAKTKLRLYGNRIMNGSSNLGNYDDRIYAYDKNLKYFRPPGIPVYPDLRTVREDV